jgi:SAM-dependent methyltransferase
VRGQNGNQIEFIEADGCQLPLPSQSFDVVLAVESIFHFGDRAAFFSEAERVLQPSGRLALSDFVPPEDKVPLLKSLNTSADEATRRTYGNIDVLCSLESYHQLAREAALSLEAKDDISVNTLPTYPFLRKHLQSWEDPADAAFFDQATARLEMACRFGLLHYTILSFEKPASQSLRRTA